MWQPASTHLIPQNCGVSRTPGGGENFANSPAQVALDPVNKGRHEAPPPSLGRRDAEVLYEQPRDLERMDVVCGGGSHTAAVLHLRPRYSSLLEATQSKVRVHGRHGRHVQ